MYLCSLNGTRQTPRNMDTNPQIELARRYIEQTGVSVFLTGKAGTGKTTFLREVAARCPKRHAIVAPTGVAAINAGGVTIHSFFQLPFEPYLPEVKELVTEYQLPERRKSLNKTKTNIIRTLEMLIIDEISMVRADLLDAIDMTLRRYRHSSHPFGGVQLLMIGDVHQLSPVVTEEERPFMERVYPSPYFFSSKALQRMPYVTIELTTVYRQQDAAFIDLLNHVRDNRIDADTLNKLNARVGSVSSKASDSQPQAITLTTHNRQADAINRHRMEALQGEERMFEATLTGNYPEKSLPCDRILTLKVGERVMFVKNDSSGARRYYNGLLGTVAGFDEDEDGGALVVVETDDGNTVFAGREKWESMRYTLNEKTNEIEQEVDGTYSQYPLQAAWAVTIHKAQGLTFDRVNIDAADAFAFGQVYVALSRCRTLDGLTLTTPLSAGVTFNDRSVMQFVNSCPTFEQATASAPAYEQEYHIEKLMELFGMDDLVYLADRLHEHYGKLKNIYPSEVSTLDSLTSALSGLQTVSEKFKVQLMHLDSATQTTRAQQGARYYHEQLAGIASKVPSLIDVEIDNKQIRKSVDEFGTQLAEMLGMKIACMKAVAEKGYSVQTVQHAKAEFIVGHNGNRPKKKNRSVKQTGKEHIDNDLGIALRNWRSAKAADLGVPVYVVLQQKALQAIVTNRPCTVAELKRQIGVGEKTVERYGDEILTIVHDYSNNKQ